MSLEVYKGTVTFVVMGTAANAAQFQRDLAGASLESIIHDADSEGLIRGDHTIVAVEHVHRDDVARELREVGNDGCFFDDELQGEDDDPDESEETGQPA